MVDWSKESIVRVPAPSDRGWILKALTPEEEKEAVTEAVARAAVRCRLSVAEEEGAAPVSSVAAQVVPDDDGSKRAEAVTGG